GDQDHPRRCTRARGWRRGHRRAPLVSAIVPIPLADARDEAELGGKATSLGAAYRAGLPVPPGVALPATLVEAFVAHDASAIVAMRSLASKMPGPLAVRSSGIGEDSACASFAGQHATKLGVIGYEQLRASVSEVWRSARSEEARAYRTRHGIE